MKLNDKYNILYCDKEELDEFLNFLELRGSKINMDRAYWHVYRNIYQHVPISTDNVTAAKQFIVIFNK